MNTREVLVDAALAVLEHEGESAFSTRRMCAMAGVTAPTLYHHFGSADGLLSAAITEAFTQFLASKKAEVLPDDAELALAWGWDNYVRFAAERPRLYSAMLVRVMQGVSIPAADAARALLMERIDAIAAAGRLAMNPRAAADLTWASAHAASSLYVMDPEQVPDPAVIDGMRDLAMRSICTPKKETNRR